MIIGIPRGLSYFDYFPMWETFFQELGLKTITSPPTNKKILNEGTSLCVDDACLPVKVFHGHVASLADKVDAIFIPRVVSVAPKEYICPKFIGLPEMIKNSIPKLPPLIVWDYNLHKNIKGARLAFKKLGKQLAFEYSRIYKAYGKAVEQQDKYETFLRFGGNPLESLCPNEEWRVDRQEKGKIGVLGHPYLLYDRYLSMDIIKKLIGKKYRVEIPDNLSKSLIADRAATMPKNLFWTCGKKILGSGLNWLVDEQIDGLIYLSSFACGIDSFVEELIRRYNARERRLPYVVFTLDEHSGEAGFETRLEAFLDMMEWRDDSDCNFSSYGNDVYSSKSIV